MIRLCEIFFSAKPGNGFPWAVGIDMSTIQSFKLVKLPDAVALAADDGRMMCRLDWSVMPMFLAMEKLGFLINCELGWESSAL
jgi:hypothetical protein